MDNGRELTPEIHARLDATQQQPAQPPPTEFDLFLAGLEDRFHPDRVNAHLWHCRTQAEFDEARDRIWDEEDDLYARPDKDGGNDGWFTDRN